MKRVDGICTDCKQQCQGEAYDFGIGKTEAWGVISVDRNVQWVSKCCNARIVDESDCDVDPPDEDPPEPEKEDRCPHDWVHTGTAYGGEDESYRGEGRVYCSKCGTDGDA